MGSYDREPDAATVSVYCVCGGGWRAESPFEEGAFLYRCWSVVEGVLAIYYGRWFVSFAQSPAFKDVAIAMLLIAVAGSAYSTYSWIRR